MKDNHFWVPVVTSVEMEISVITDAEIAKFSLDIEREKERAYTVGKSTLTLGAHLPPVPVDLSIHEAHKAQTAARYEK